MARGHCSRRGNAGTQPNAPDDASTRSSHWTDRGQPTANTFNCTLATTKTTPSRSYFQNTTNVTSVCKGKIKIAVTRDKRTEPKVKTNYIRDRTKNFSVFFYYFFFFYFLFYFFFVYLAFGNATERCWIETQGTVGWSVLTMQAVSFEGLIRFQDCGIKVVSPWRARDTKQQPHKVDKGRGNKTACVSRKEGSETSPSNSDQNLKFAAGSAATLYKI